MNNLEDIRQRWLRERPELDAFGELLRGRIQERVRLAGILAIVDARTKAIDSILKKLLLKREHSYESLPDLVGVRVVVRYRPEVQRVIKIVSEAYACTGVDDKSVRLAEDGVGYLSVHTEARLQPGDSEVSTFPPERFRAEVQMRTLAQHLWAEMSHDTFYKTEDQTLSSELKRRVNLMAGLLEVADTEFARLNCEVAELPNMAEIRLLKQLEANYFQFASDRGNPDLSLEVIKLLLPLYDVAVPAIGPRLQDFVNERRDTIIEVFRQQQEVPQKRSVFFTQPEIFMLYERLEHDRLAVRERWSAFFPESELERIALAFGISLD